MSEEQQNQNAEEKQEAKSTAPEQKETTAPKIKPVEQTAPETKITEPKAQEQKEEVIVPKKFEKIIEAIESMTVLELHNLVQIFEKKFDVSATITAAAPSGGGEKTEAEGGLVSLTLEETGASKIQIIKIVKEILVLGLKEAKDFVDGAPKVLKEGITTDEADEIKKKLEEGGAKVSIK